MLGPLPRWLTRCAYPFLPLSHRPSPNSHRVGCSTLIRSTTSERGVLSRLQSFDNLQASEFAATQVVPTAGHPLRMPGRPWRLRPSTARFVTSPRTGYASRPNRAIDGIGLSPTRFAALPAATGNFTPSRSQNPDLTLSRHPARAIARRLPPSAENSGSSRLTRLTQARRRWPAPFAPRALPRFSANTEQSAPNRRIGTFGLAVGAACAFSLSIAV